MGAMEEFFLLICCSTFSTWWTKSCCYLHTPNILSDAEVFIALSLPVLGYNTETQQMAGPLVWKNMCRLRYHQVWNNPGESQTSAGTGASGEVTVSGRLLLWSHNVRVTSQSRTGCYVSKTLFFFLSNQNIFIILSSAKIWKPWRKIDFGKIKWKLRRI